MVDMSGCRIVIIEMPSNPGLAVCDIAEVAKRAKAASALLVADNTTATPICQQPLDLGVDITLMADTKAMAGHSDILAVHVATRDSRLLETVRTWRRLAGAIASRSTRTCFTGEWRRWNFASRAQLPMLWASRKHWARTNPSAP
nr:PLP-dependent transferase [uncultured Hyphomonas sp.]